MTSPIIVTYSFTRQCNLKCGHCYSNSGERENQELSQQKTKEVVEQIAKAGSRVLIFDGGEPLMREDIYDLISHAGKFGLKTVLGTNGTLVTPAVVNKLKDAGVNHCAVSIDGSNPGTHEWLRGVKGCFNKAVRGAKLIQEAGIPLQINTCLNGKNQHEINEIIKLAESLKADSIQFFFYNNSGRNSSQVMPPDVDKRLSENVKSKINIRLIGRIGIRGSKCCTAGENVCCILNDGTVYPCMLLHIPLGNVMENTLQKIWENSLVLKDLIEKKNGIFKGFELCRLLRPCP
ncbi:MAG TPA: radical SAM protein [Candidatus Methylomirabilis sp.]|nr:radical SAM protein [Candidatus Methylomirabilis sp.]